LRGPAVFANETVAWGGSPYDGMVYYLAYGTRMSISPCDKMIAQQDGPIGWIIFNQPERHNAVSLAMWEALEVIVDHFENNPEIRIVVVRGAGEKAFVSGADISEFETQRSGEAATRHYNETSQRAMRRLRELRKPTLAMIQGYCIGGGLAVALSCDIRLSADNARFAVPAAKLGLGYEYEGVRKLVDLVGPSFAKEIFFTARQFNAQEALEMGLINRVVSVDQLASLIQDYATTIAANAPMTVASIKTIVGEIVKDETQRDIALCDRVVDECFNSQDYREGRTAFMEKRKPVFQGR
jgi:enoyl-CoA hydratase